MDSEVDVSIHDKSDQSNQMDIELTQQQIKTEVLINLFFIKINIFF